MKDIGISRRKRRDTENYVSTRIAIKATAEIIATKRLKERRMLSESSEFIYDRKIKYKDVKHPMALTQISKTWTSLVKTRTKQQVNSSILSQA